jgi:iron complex transport system permease protein
MLFWLMGDLADPQGLAAATVLLALGLVCATLASGGLDVLSAGLDKAATLGLAVGRWQAALYFAAALFTVAALQLGGSIGFVGLMMPHAVRLLGVTAHRWLVPGAALLGGAFLLLADTLARTAWSPLQLPVGIFTALLGVPVLLWLLARGR